MKLVETMVDADVVFVAHRGIGQAGAMSDLIHGRLTGSNLEIAIWRVDARDVPREPAAIREFLVEQWERVDDFVARREHTGDPVEVPGSIERVPPGDSVERQPAAARRETG